jgi:hypothetical protein
MCLVALGVDVPDEDPDREIDNVGHCFAMAFGHVAPDVSKPTHRSLHFVFMVLLKEHMTNALAVARDGLFSLGWGMLDPTSIEQYPEKPPPSQPPRGG